MPIYTYECSCGHIFDEIFHVADRPDTMTCPKCEGVAGRIISPHGAILTDGDVKWLDSACKTLLRDGDPPITTRTEYKRYLKDHGLIAVG